MSMDITGIGSVADFFGKVIDKVWPDPAQAAKAKLDLFNAQQAGQLAEEQSAWDNAKAQLGVDQAEAGNESLFVSGWRPFIGWTCGAAFGYKFILAPLAAFVLTALGHQMVLPDVQLADMMPVLLGMLGLGAMRSYEKVKGPGAGNTPPGAGS